MKLGPNSKPHRGNAGYVCEMKAKLGGHVVIYDREAPGVSIDADERWIVMHEPSSRHIAIGSKAHARSVMQGVARARTVEEACEHADILPTADDAAEHEEPVDKQKRGGNKALYADDAERDRLLDIFMADPENEPSEAGIAARRKLFGTAS
jgi:hypothetical protein